MPAVDITVGKREFQFVCGEGQEEHLRGLAAEVSQKIETLSHSMEGASETMLVVMSSLMMQDELNSFSTGQVSGGVSEDEKEQAVDEAVTEAVNAISDYIETVAQRI